jgi:hypothetical protein
LNARSPSKPPGSGGDDDGDGRYESSNRSIARSGYRGLRAAHSVRYAFETISGKNVLRKVLWKSSGWPASSPFLWKRVWKKSFLQIFL